MKKCQNVKPCFPVPPLFVQAAVLIPQPSSLATQSCPDWLALLLLLMTPTGKQKDDAMKSNTHWTTFARRPETLLKWDSHISLSVCNYVLTY